MIEGAGGVVWRRTRKGRVKVLLVHRPSYGDWSLPKGKLQSGEDALAAAIREVREETGLRCKVGDELAEARYRDRKGRKKSVRYWAMRPRGGRFRPNDEVDRVTWVRLERVTAKLSYAHDREVVARLDRVLARVGGPTG
jgi:8-oxo-dGTP pyrophosphatase MutT (NUDIX family)